MRVIFIKDYRRKLAVSILIILLWTAMFLLADFFIHNSFIFNVTVNNYLSFSYPPAFEVDGIFVNERMERTPVKASYSFRKPDSGTFSDYKSAKDKLGQGYPSAFAPKAELQGNEVLYHIDFHNKPETSGGFIQVWETPLTLEEFLGAPAVQTQGDLKYFTSNPVSVGRLPGFFWSYSIKDGNGKFIKGSEVFFRKGGIVYRISYFVPEKLWSSTEKDIFQSIVNSFKAY